MDLEAFPSFLLLWLKLGKRHWQKPVQYVAQRQVFQVCLYFYIITTVGLFDWNWGLEMMGWVGVIGFVLPQLVFLPMSVVFNSVQLFRACITAGWGKWLN